MYDSVSFPIDVRRKSAVWKLLDGVIPNADPVCLLSNIVDAISDHDAQLLDDLWQLIEKRRNQLKKELAGDPEQDKDRRHECLNNPNTF
jgi:hypothetical protein